MITVLILKTWFMQLRSAELSIGRSFCHSNFSSIARIDCEWRSKLTAPCEIANWHESTVLWTSVQLWLAGENQFISYSVYLNDISPCGCTPVCLLIRTLLSAVFQTQIWIRNHPHVHRQSTNKSVDCIWYQVLNCGDTYTLTLRRTHTRSLLIMAASSIFSVFLIIWSVGHRPCRFHGSLLLIKINSIQLHRSWGLLLHNWIWFHNESRAKFSHLWSVGMKGRPPGAGANIWQIRTEGYSYMTIMAIQRLLCKFTSRPSYIANLYCSSKHNLVLHFSQIF